jgi:hypothetical protein
MRSRTKRSLTVAAVVALIAVVGLWLALPAIALHQVNRRIDNLGGYHGHVDDIDLALWKGAYRIEGLTFEKIGGTAEVPFAEVPVIDITLEWRALLNGAVVAQVQVEHPVINFVNGDTEAEKQAGTGVDWRKELTAMLPLRLDRLVVHDGEIRFADFSSEPEVDVTAYNLEIEARNLTNSRDLAGTMVATIDATGRTVGYGKFTLHALVDPYEQAPTFDLDAKLEDVNLTALNSLFSGYGRFDAEAGQMDVYAELVSNESHLRGYVKPVLTGARIIDVGRELERDREGPARVTWEALVGLVSEVLTNPAEEDVAAKVPVGGTIDAPRPDTWGSVWSAVQNAFLEALFKGLDNEVSARDLQQEAGRRR